MKPAIIETYQLRRTFNAPIDFVFDWCTDFREDDGKMTGSKTKRRILERTKKRIIWTVNYTESGKPREGLRVVWLSPPDSWHLDTCGDYREVGDYKLTALGKGKTRLDAVFNVTYDDPGEVETKEKWEKETGELWTIFTGCLENEYGESGRSAKPKAR
ncbi:MAG: hypothetical protein OK441_05595 [Thaumarchaeota archaeon]|nr:hypothetical protein [Nitrososphaerota archaeon]